MIGKFKKWWDEHCRRRYWFIVVFDTKSYKSESKSYRSFNKTRSRNFTCKDIHDLEVFCEEQAVKNGHVKPNIVIRNVIYVGKMSIATWNGRKKD